MKTNLYVHILHRYQLAQFNNKAVCNPPVSKLVRSRVNTALTTSFRLIKYTTKLALITVF